MSHGYYYICDHCKTQLKIEEAPDSCMYNSIDYKFLKPSKWLEIVQPGANTLNFCSKKCVVKFAENPL